ncbi:PREDICTED: zinc finger CCCH domain-containing protein 63-like isoform X2 [Tarenaya hassleriana]|uniref:zinc finger CCCH domain-containing protein 63-like isoform X2 n=1 Tax=Tarenaya hassleriana TaxID=28532 RepID=UPI00053C6D41|nr:PREDICTED: zinc finger CCCH domain-containing protein 63-like isoform X2 [Tarenaya hassleriana]
MQSSDQSSENVEDDEETRDLAQQRCYPDHPDEPDCLYYLRTGSCGYGSNCRFNHPVSAAQGVLSSRDEFPERIGQPNCEYFLKTGACKYGASCKYHHPKDRNGALPIFFNILGLPMRQDRKCCSYYMRTGTCKFGNTCKFHHPQPTSHVPLNGTPSVYGGFSAWSVPRLSYMNGLSLQGPSGYIPFMVSPSHSILSAPSFDTFTSSSSTDIIGSINRHDSVHNLPERPDQPECRYYMNSGTCRYGSDCRFYHSKERITHIESSSSAMNSVTLHSRPGQSICASYMIHGVCKFGSGCRFDHPLPQYPYASMFDSSAYLAYPRLSPIANPFVKTQTLPSRDSDRTKNMEPGREDGSLLSKKPVGMSEKSLFG